MTAFPSNAAIGLRDSHLQPVHSTVAALFAMHCAGEVSVVDGGMATARRDASRIGYSIADPCIPGARDLALCLIEETIPRR